MARAGAGGWGGHRQPCFARRNSALVPAQGLHRGQRAHTALALALLRPLCRSNSLPRALADCTALTKLTVQCSGGLPHFQVLASLKALEVGKSVLPCAHRPPHPRICAALAPRTPQHLASCPRPLLLCAAATSGPSCTQQEPVPASQ